MKKRNSGRRIILASFILLICLPWLLWLLPGSVLPSENHENRRLADMPKLRPGTYRRFASDFSDYLNDSMPFRNELVALNSGIDYYLFRTSPTSKVLLGKDGWLFYNNPGDGFSLDDYQGNNLLTEEELARIAENCVRQRDTLASLGKPFLIFIAPNKERVYSEYMPSWCGEPAEHYRALQVYSYLTEHTDLRVLYAYDELMRAKSLVGEPLFYRTDTHWNAVGAYVGSRLLLRELGIALPGIESGQIGVLAQGGHTGDLANLMNLGSRLSSGDPEYLVSGYPTHRLSEPDGDILTDFDCTAADADERKLYVLRDSFAIAMYPYLASQFRESSFRHYSHDLHEDLLEKDPDIVVLEIVERKLDSLATFSV